jgi:peroxiredoxin
VTLLSYYFTDGHKFDYNDKKTFTSYIYNEKGVPVRNARFRNIDFLIMAGESQETILAEIRAEIKDHPANWIAQTVYWRKVFESARTFERINSIYDDANKEYQKLVQKYGKSDSLKHVKANFIADYRTSLYGPFQELQEKANTEFMAVMGSIPLEKQYGSVKHKYLSYLEYQKRSSGSTEFLANIIGSIAPDFEYKTVMGAKGKLSDLRGNYVLLDFWGTWCKPCVNEIPNLKKVYAEYHQEGFEILSISSDSFEAEKLKEYVTEKDMNWLQVLDGQSGPMQQLYKIMSYPSLFLIDPDGKVVSMNNELRGELLNAKLKEIYGK